MTDQSDSKNDSDPKDTSSKSRPRVCGTLFLWEAERKQKQRKELQKSSENELLQSEQTDHSK